MSNIKLIVSILGDKGHSDVYQLLYWYNQQSTISVADLESVLATCVRDGVVGSYMDRGCKVYYFSKGW